MLSSSADPVRWRRLSALLDEGLDLAGAQRVAWLRDMAAREPDLVDELRQMLADHEASAQAGFLTGVAGPARGGTDPAASLGGQTLGAYTLERPIGQGGMGSVWRAERSDGETLTARGDAYRNPKDTSQPMIGEEIAAARGLIALGAELLQSASSRIEQTTHQPVHLYR